ncbi:MAG: alpha/beta fold hydrolase, partial [Kordiimonas sp.]
MMTGDVRSIQSNVRQFNFQGFPIHTRAFGVASKKPPLVFVGGAFQNIANVVPLCEAIAEDNYVIAVDTPGNGMTGVLPDTYSFEFICDAINHALVSQGIGEINLFGCSY